jgi:hypothetical protein
MKNGPSGTCFDPEPSVPALVSCRRRHEGGRRVRFHPIRNAVWASVVGLAATLAAPQYARAQEPLVPPGSPNAYLMPSRPHHWWSFLSSNDGIPRTYSYYYTPWLNQPRHIRVVGPDGKTYWTSTVRGLPMGTPWLAP